MKNVGIDTRLQDETGVGRYIRNIVKGINQSSHSINLISLNPHIRWHSIEEQYKLWYFLQKQDIDLMHFPYFTVPIMYSKPFVVTIHDLIIDTFDTGLASTKNNIVYKIKRIAYKKVVKHAVDASCAIIVPSNATRDELCTRYNVLPDKITVIAEGIDDRFLLKKVHSPHAERVQKMKEKKFILYVGNAYPHKNLETLIKAFSYIQDPHIWLLMVGKEDYFYDKLKDYVDKRTIHNVIFTGYVDDYDLSWLYSHTQALVMPSLMEGFGLPALEALYHGCPAIVSDIPAFREVCKDAAYYFNPRNPQVLSSLMVSVLHDTKDAKKTMQIKGKQLAKQYSWKYAAEQTLLVYERCLSL